MGKPWRGKEYGTTRLLILGESAYSWEENGEIQHPTDDHAEGTVTSIIANFDKAARTMKMISRALADEESPSAERLQFVWDRVTFTNYVDGTVGEGARTPPNQQMWDNAKRQFRPLLEELHPRRIIVLGSNLWSNMPETDFYLTDHVQGYRLADRTLVMCQQVLHPAGGLSWRQLAAVVYFSYEREMRAK